MNFNLIINNWKTWIEKIVLYHYLFKLIEEKENNWKADLLKCKDTDEALFQHTIMIDLINQHKLNLSLDYICESQWTCNHMSQRKKEEAVKLT